MGINIRITVKVPETVFESKFIVDNIARAQREKTAPKLTQLFGKTVVGWRNAPEFSRKQKISTNFISMSVFPSGLGAEQYTLVNEGAQPHIIAPRRAGLLRFQTGYRPSTKPRFIGSRAFTRSGRFIGARIVSHPGFEARKFDEAIAEEHLPEFVQDMQNAIKVK